MKQFRIGHGSYPKSSANHLEFAEEAHLALSVLLERGVDPIDASAAVVRAFNGSHETARTKNSQVVEIVYADYPYEVLRAARKVSDLAYWEEVTQAIEAYDIPRSDAQGIVMVPSNDVVIATGYMAGRSAVDVAADLMSVCVD